MEVTQKQAQTESGGGLQEVWFFSGMVNKFSLVSKLMIKISACFCPPDLKALIPVKMQRPRKMEYLEHPRHLYYGDSDLLNKC